MRRAGFFLGVLGLLCVFMSFANGIECYKCESTVGGSDCDALYNVSADTREEQFSRNCTGVGDFCVIETFSQHKTDMYSMIRDCSDNTTYSFNISFPLNLDLPPNPKDVAENRTKCGFDNIFQVCVLLCNTSYCNGPSRPVSRGSALVAEMFLVWGTFLLLKEHFL
ncbi:ly6/PLAUR domain-containing protein 1-like isoform X2 [Haliotis asinina]|uniref:ly6/PLAUR domain-containing protein 1-like isoform X2 n=1 Tax=Haliotis asinina TaxID=109174 RepID=UPI003531801E